MKYFLGLLLFFASTLPGYAQLLSWTPSFSKDNDNIIITMDAAKGNQGLLNYTPTTDVYVHVGLITSASANPGDWRYSKFTWASTTPAAQCTYLGNSKWQYTINNPRTFFNSPAGVPAGEVIKFIVILFRSGNGNVVQRNMDGTDMYIPVYDNNLAVRITEPLMQPTYKPIPEPIIKTVGDNITLTGIANQNADLTLAMSPAFFQQALNSTTVTGSALIVDPGWNMIILGAHLNPNQAHDTAIFFAAPALNVQAIPPGMRDGINYEPGGTSAVLVLYAPGKSRVTVVGEFPGTQWIEQPNRVMNKTPDGNYWWIRLTGLTPGTEYAFQYVVDGYLKIAEPYAEKILDPANDGGINSTTYPGLRSYPSGTSGIVSLLQTNAPGYNWAVNNFQRPDKRNLIAYELLLRDFLAGHDWKTLKDTLKYLKNLGVNAVEIMPFNEFEGNSSWGYNPSFFFAPDKYYGPKNSLKEFIDSCHANGIAVIMDMVLNHATGSCPLAQLYWNISTNQPAANSPWFNVNATHPFNVFNDFNHESLATRYFSSRVMEHWLQEYKLDGFRFDLSKGFTQTNSGSNVALWGQYDASRVAIWKRYYDTMQLKMPGSYVILEHFADNTEEIELSEYGMMLWGNAATNFQEAAMGFLGNSNFDHLLYNARGWSKPHLLGYMESHDEERMMYKNLNFGNSSGSYNTRDLTTALKRMEMSASYLFNMPGPKLIWEFGELGYDFSINRCIDGSINNNCRLDPKPIRWDYLQQTGRKRLHDVYAALLKLRAEPRYKDVFIANNISVSRSMSAGFKWLTIRSATDTSMLCVLGNFDVNAVTSTFTFPSAGTWYDYLNGTTITTTGAAQTVSMQPGEYHVFLNRNITNAVITPVTNLNGNGSVLLLSSYPNPVQPNSVIEIYTPVSGQVSIELLNGIGQRITTLHSGFLSKGNHILQFKRVSSLTAGNYLIRASSGASNTVYRVSVLK